MKRILLLLLGGFLCSSIAVAQISINQRGKATQELRSDGISIAHPSLPINSTVRVTNTRTGKEVDATVVDRIPASPNRIADLSAGAWQELGLAADSEIRISSIPAVRQRPPSTPAIDAIPDPPAPAIAQADPTPPAQPPATPSQPAGAPGTDLNLTINNLYDNTPTAPAPVRTAPPPPPPVQPVQPVRYAPDADLQVRLAAVNAMAQQYQQQPRVQAPPPQPVKETHVQVEAPVYQILIVPVYQIQQAPPPPPPPPPAPVAVPVVPAMPMAAVPVYPAPMMAAPMAVVPPPPAYARLRVYPGFPDPNCGQIYYLQVASYLIPEAANRTAYYMRGAGFNVVQERYGPYYRVLLPNVPAAMVYPTIQRLGATGFIEEVWIR